MWKTFITTSGGKIPNDFPLSTLAHISEGYSAGSINDAVKAVLTDYRVKRQDYNHLNLAEFVGQLSSMSSTMDDQYQELKDFTDFVTGDAAKRKKLEALADGDGADGGPKKKKKKKG